MTSKREFAENLADRNLPNVDQAIAFLWFYRRTQEFDELTSSELANDLHTEGLGNPNASRLHQALLRTRFVVRGDRPRAFKINLRYLAELDNQYDSLLNLPAVAIQDSVLPSEWVLGTRGYLEGMVRQINGSYQLGFYDCCAVMCRRLMESLIIEVYVHRNRASEIQQDRTFFSLGDLIDHLVADPSIVSGRNLPAGLKMMKKLGDIAAHDRVYITPEVDIREEGTRIRYVIRSLLALSNVRP